MKTSRPSPLLAAGRMALAGLAATTVAGCAGYRLGASLPPDIRSVHVIAFVNRTREPQIEAEMTRATMREFQRDGALRVAKAGDADALLQAEIIAYDLAPLRYERDSIRTTREYRITVTARIVFTRRGATQPMVDTLVIGEATFQPGGDMTSAKVAALPIAARDLAHEIVKNVVEYWP